MRKITKEKIYELKITDDMEDESGIDSISLVDTPAIEINWVAFSKEKEHEFHIPDGEDHLYLEKLIPYGQDEQELLDEGYEIDSIEYKKDGEFIYSNPNQPSDLDTNLFRIRYKYMLNPQAGGRPIISTTRDFCKELINKNLVFRLEDMLNQQNDEGSSFADWRGGYNCRHIFGKIIYKKKGDIKNNAGGKREEGLDILGSPQNDTRTSNPSFGKEGFVGEKISIDFDDTLGTPRGEALALHLISQGYKVYVVTRRQKSMSAEVYEVSDKVGIPRDRVIFTKGKLKWEVLKELGVKRHYDNSDIEIKAIRENAPKIEAIKFKVEKMESYTDYPDSVKNNAKAVLKWVDENGWGSCGTPVGKTRVNQLAKGEPISEDTIKRMYSYLSRHKVDLDSSKSYDDGCGKLMYDSWGGLTALSWAESKVKSFNKQKFLESCPTATQDVETNLKNRQECIDVANYGPLNPNEPNEEYWKKKADMFGGDVKSAKKSLCGNCAFFVKTKSMLDCIANGINDTNEWDTIDAGDLGYCEAFDFKCAGSRTCDAWVVGGPITEEDMGYDNNLPSYVDQLPKKKKKQFVTDSEKRTIIGPAMVPDLEIPRRDIFGTPYKVFFTRETIAQIAEKYMRNKYLDNNDLMHDGKAVSDVYVVESWIVEDPETDKSKKYGFEVPAGTWMISMKCGKTPKGDEVWEQIKSKKLQGFSVSGFFIEQAASFAEELFLQQVAEILSKIKE